MEVPWRTRQWPLEIYLQACVARRTADEARKRRNKTRIYAQAAKSARSSPKLSNKKQTEYQYTSGLKGEAPTLVVRKQVPQKVVSKIFCILDTESSSEALGSDLAVSDTWKLPTPDSSATRSRSVAKRGTSIHFSDCHPSWIESATTTNPNRYKCVRARNSKI